MSTLAEELEQAAFRAEVRAQETTSEASGARWMHLLKGHIAEAARLRARAAHVSALSADWLRQCQESGSEPAAICLLAFERLAAPIPVQGTAKETDR